MNKDTPMCRCAHCGYDCPAAELTLSRRLSERLDYPIGHPKCVLPAGDCPKCGAFSYPVPKGWAKVEGGVQWPMAHAHPANTCGLLLPLHVPVYGAPLEHAIVRGLIVALARAGFVPVAVWDSEEYQIAEGRTVAYREADRGKWLTSSPMTVAEVLDSVFSVGCESTIHFAPRERLNYWGAYGVLVVPGNGQDLISDHHPRKGAWTDAIEAYTDALHDSKKHALVIVTGADIEVHS